MTHARLVEAIPQLERYGNVVPDGYKYYEKVVAAAEDLSLPSTYLKWYDLYPADVPISPQQAAESRAFVAQEAERLNLDHELGFVILHRAGSFLLLMLMTWRNTNEIWESVYVKDTTREEGYRLNEFENSHRGTFCVWELGIVWHERHAWVRFLLSERDNAAKLAYLNDRFSGRV